MIQICRKNKESLQCGTHGKKDVAEMSFLNLTDDIFLTMKQQGLMDLLSAALQDKRKDNEHIPFGILLSLAVAAKLKLKTSLTDLTFAVTEAGLLAGLEYLG